MVHFDWGYNPENPQTFKEARKSIFNNEKEIILSEEKQSQDKSRQKERLS